MTMTTEPVDYADVLAGMYEVAVERRTVGKLMTAMVDCLGHMVGTANDPVRALGHVMILLTERADLHSIVAQREGLGIRVS